MPGDNRDDAARSDPLRPTFGADIWRYIDFPINLALPAIVSELTSAITIWEPRVTLVSVTAQPVIDASAQSGAHLDVTLNWQLKLGVDCGARSDHDRDNPGSDGLVRAAPTAMKG